MFKPAQEKAEKNENKAILTYAEAGKLLNKLDVKFSIHHFPLRLSNSFVFCWSQHQENL